MDTAKYNSDWKGLYRLGWVAALLAGLVFRRNIGAEVSLFSPQRQPTTVADWLSLLQTNPLLGLTYLDVFDLVDYALVGLMFLALFVVLQQVSHSTALVAVFLGWAGVVVYFTANTSLSMLAVSRQYAAASGLQRSMLLTAGQTLLAQSNLLNPGTGLYLSLLFVALAGLLFSSLMLRSKDFTRITAYLGLLAGALDLVYCLTFTFLPALITPLIASAGLLLFIWHILVARDLFKMEKRT